MENVTEVGKHTVNEVLDRYIAESLPGLGERTQKDYARHIRVLREYFGDRIAAELVPDDFTAFMRVPTGQIQRNRILAVLSAVFSIAQWKWHWLNYNVCLGVPRNVSKSRPRYVTPQEFDGFKRMIPRRLQLIADLARYTGQPQGNIRELRWSQMHEHEGIIQFQDVKTKARRKVEVPITPELRSILKECKKLPARGGLVVGKGNGKVYTAEGLRAIWQRYMRKWVDSGNERFTFHDIRYTWVTSAKASTRKITFMPTVFEAPERAVERDFVAVMMPFRTDFDPVYNAMKEACADCNLRCSRANDIWEETVIIQDIFNLIYRAHVVIVDFSGRNPNVMYETGIAHTLGKQVVPISQSLDDVPFDIKHHRVLRYLPNQEGLAELRVSLAKRLGFIAG